MPKRKKSSVGRHSAKAKRLRASRAHIVASAGSTEEEVSRLERIETASSSSKASETSQQKSAKSESYGPASEKLEQKLAQLEKKRAATKKNRELETYEQKSARLEKDRTNTKKKRVSETVEQKSARIEKERAAKKINRASETRERKLARMEKDKAAKKKSKILETIKLKSIRLENNRNSRRKSKTTVFNIGIDSALNYDPVNDYKSGITPISMNSICQFCNARRFPRESTGICCNNGKVVLTPIQPIPEVLKMYMNNDTPVSKHFLRDIRQYNSAFQMTSFGTEAIQGKGYMPTFKIKGQIYHQIGSLLPSDEETPKFLQIFFLTNEDEEIRQRQTVFPKTSTRVIADLQAMLHSENHLISSFKAALEDMPTDEYLMVIRERAPSGHHKGRYHLQTTSEVGVIMVGTECDKRDIVLKRRSGELQRIRETHISYDALQYPLMYPYGQDSYFQGMFCEPHPLTGKTFPTKITSTKYYSYRMMVRDTPNHLLNCRQLLNQYIVDAYAKIESERLLYIRLNQSKLRVENYIHLRDALSAEGANPAETGQLCILPSSYIGSPRHMHEYAQDGLTYCKNFGAPQLFITFTCNPAWPEIQEQLSDGQTASDRNDITARVFNQKLICLMEMLTKIGVAGKCRCWLYSIEWQKRGLPHAHILIWLHSKIRLSEIDKLISAEIPDPAEDEALFATVTKNMLHGPCGPSYPNSPCMQNEKKQCSKGFPKLMVPETQTTGDGYPIYRRRSPADGGLVFKKTIHNKSVIMDNRWVVPYCPLLSKVFDAHINVEYCFTVKVIQYILKYVFKGTDMATAELGKSHDEVNNYITGRFLNANEAFWHIFQFKIHDRYPSVTHLSVHLENGQRVYYTPQNAVQKVMQPPETTLTAFFALCKSDDFAKTLFYHEVPMFYTWNNASKKFSRRKQGVTLEENGLKKSDTLGRVYTVHPSNSECYYLRLLLHHVRGPTSFNFLKTVEGTICDTFREACDKLGLLENDRQWDAALEEAKKTMLPKQTRELFAVIVTACAPSNPTRLWENHKDFMSHDFLMQLRKDLPHTTVDTNHVYNQSLIALEDQCLLLRGKSLQDLYLPSPERKTQESGPRLAQEVIRETSYSIDKLSSFIAKNKHRLLSDQLKAYNRILHAVASKKGHILFLSAPGGTGKTFVLNLILAEVPSRGEIALAMASSGIAATLLENGKTAHSTLKLPLNIASLENPVCNIKKRSGTASLLRDSRLIVWDECTMSHKKSLQALNRTLQDIRNNTDVMGGTTLLLAGDFRQTLPVMPNSTPADEINACLKKSPLWKKVETLSLTTNMRAHLTGDLQAAEFAKQILKVGDGRYPIDVHPNTVTISADICEIVPSENKLLQCVYPAMEINFTNQSWLRERAILAPTNDSVNQLNAMLLTMLPTTEQTYLSIDSAMDDEEAVNFPVEFLNSLEPPGMPPYKLTLREGSPVMLLRNIEPPRLCNGTRLVIKSLQPNVLLCTILTGTAQGEEVFIPRIPLVTNDQPIHFRRLQFPLRVAFSMTVNKAQGQSLSFAGVDLRNNCFSHGQLYVALSRVGCSKNLTVLTENGDGRTRNIVYKEALQ